MDNTESVLCLSRFPCNSNLPEFSRALVVTRGSAQFWHQSQFRSPEQCLKSYHACIQDHSAPECCSCVILCFRCRCLRQGVDPAPEPWPSILGSHPQSGGQHASFLLTARRPYKTSHLLLMDVFSSLQSGKRSLLQHGISTSAWNQQPTRWHVWRRPSTPFLDCPSNCSSRYSSSRPLNG